jgi:uridine kinase
MIPKLVLGISGDSGVGKTSLVKMLNEIFFKDDYCVLNGDNYHKWERGDKNWKYFTHLNTNANRVEDGYLDLLSLKEGKDISVTPYDHKTGKYTKLKRCVSSKTIVYEGLHAFLPEKINCLYDLKIFIKADEPLRRHWKITRDIQERQYSREKVLKQIETRASDSLNFINTQEKHADLIIHHQLISDASSFIQLQGDPQITAEYETKIICCNPIYYDYINPKRDFKDQLKKCLMKSMRN